ncbi:hypothetical protein [Microbacterium sp. 22242]|uniref:hypothetical protein n=1 Tax=Microbacterium sp. 22242 TaxID=3453896 RepID=UPI003F861DFC
MNSIDNTPKLVVGTQWKQERFGADGQPEVRIIEIIGRPTLSSPVAYKVIRNDAHPHRKGKTASIRVADLLRKYEAVEA